MSRGHGIIEQTILAACVSGELKPLVYIAQQVDYDPAKLSVRQSFSRAARNLAWEKGLADLYDLSVPTVTGLSGPTNYRDITCVCRSGLEITDQMWTNAPAFAMSVYQPELFEKMESDCIAEADIAQKNREAAVRIFGEDRADEMMTKTLREMGLEA